MLSVRALSELDLTIIIVSYNTCRQTIDCIRSVRNSTFATSYEIIVVDNASTDGSVKELRAAFPNIHVIASSENLGFASANNLAEQHARGRRLLLLIQIPSSCITRLTIFTSSRFRTRVVAYGVGAH